MAPADSEEDLASMEEDSLASGSNLAAPDNSIRQQFQEYVEEEVTNGKPLDKYEKEGIKVLALLKRKKTSLDTTMRLWNGIYNPLELLTFAEI